MINAKCARVVLIMFAVLGAAVSHAAERREILSYVEVGEHGAASEQKVEGLIEAFKTTWAAQDTAAHMRLFSEDAEWINAYARMFRGKEELSRFLEERLFPNFDAAVSVEEMRNSQLVSIRYLGDSAAVIHIATDGARGDSAIAGELLRRTHLHLVVENFGGEWLIVHTAIMDARG